MERARYRIFVTRPPLYAAFYASIHPRALTMTQGGLKRTRSAPASPESEPTNAVDLPNSQASERQRAQRRSGHAERCKIAINASELKALVRFVEAVVEPDTALSDLMNEEASDYPECFFDAPTVNNVGELQTLCKALNRKLSLYWS